RPTPPPGPSGPWPTGGSTWSWAATAAPSPARRPRPPPAGARCSGRPGRWAIPSVAGQLAHKPHREPSSLRFAIAAVDDVYGHAVADGARAELRDRGLEASADVAYDPRRYAPAKVVAEGAAAAPDVLLVVAYLEDGVALRREQVRQHLPLL